MSKVNNFKPLMMEEMMKKMWVGLPATSLMVKWQGLWIMVSLVLYYSLEQDFCRVDSTISRATSMSRAMTPRERKGSVVSQGYSPEAMAPHGSFVGSVGNTGIGGGWQLAWQWTGPEGTEGKAGQGEFKRVYLFQEGPTEASRMGSMYSLPRYDSTVSNLEPIQAAALVSRPSQYGKDLKLENQVGPALLHPAEIAKKGPSWSELLEGGVRQALLVGVVLQILEQVVQNSFVSFALHLFLKVLTFPLILW